MQFPSHFLVLLSASILACVGCDSRAELGDSATLNNVSEPTVAGIGQISVPRNADFNELDRTEPQWHRFEFNDKNIAVAVVTVPSFGNSYIDVYGYVYNDRLSEWRRFLAANTQDAGRVEVSVDNTSGQLIVIGAANNLLKNKTIVAFDLRAMLIDSTLSDAR